MWPRTRAFSIAIPAQLSSEQLEGPVEARRAAVERERVVAIFVSGRIPEPGICNESAHPDLHCSLGDRVRRVRCASLEKAGRAVADHLKAGQKRRGMFSLVVDGIQERHEELGLDVVEKTSCRRTRLGQGGT